ncbi:MAG: cupin domain-containing protein [Pseudomonadota bacterium]|nr:cupin domain-containing protein [Pseudomonadota bacterium]
MHVLGHLSIEEFLRDYWQKKPVLIRQAIPEFQALLAADELAGLSLEDDIESRLIIEEGNNGPWEVRKGPFNEDDYRSLPDNKWTLLVQAVDHWIPEAAELLEHFRFIPSWRIDDLMISYAVDGGSVGPHYDQYDVFLLQAEGQREWRIGQMCSETTPLLQGPSVRILADFAETDRWVLEPGDMLYLPPGLAHWGISQGECMTYSIGFRAPSVAELLEQAMDDLHPQLTPDQRYRDADLSLNQQHGEIDADAIARCQALLTQALSNPTIAANVLGGLMTAAKYPEQAPEFHHDEAPSVSVDALEEADIWQRHPMSRLAYHTTPLTLFCQGESLHLPEEDIDVVSTLCNQSQYCASELRHLCESKSATRLIEQLISQDILIPVD